MTRVKYSPEESSKRARAIYESVRVVGLELMKDYLLTFPIRAGSVVTLNFLP